MSLIALLQARNEKRSLPRDDHSLTGKAAESYNHILEAAPDRRRQAKAGR